LADVFDYLADLNDTDDISTETETALEEYRRTRGL
jgi:hypothetical protein